ncbi:MAG: hypothetical protein MZU84_09255 [Sphingobacterium sp.]|nr:hypothetical protein [Sphingobacterium sp.]
MSPTRRSFIKTGTISLAALGLPRLAGTVSGRGAGPGRRPSRRSSRTS